MSIICGAYDASFSKLASLSAYRDSRRSENHRILRYQFHWLARFVCLIVFQHHWGVFWEHLETVWVWERISVWERFGSVWERSGSDWEVWGTRGALGNVLGAFGRIWNALGAFGVV